MAITVRIPAPLRKVTNNKELADVVSAEEAEAAPQPPVGDVLTDVYVRYQS